MKGDRVMERTAEPKAGGLPCAAPAWVVDDACEHDSCSFAPRFRGLAE